MQNALILFGHGARDPEWASPLVDVRKRVLSMQPDTRVELAFLEFMQPDLAVLVAQLANEGVQEITVLPMFIAQGGHLKRELPEIMHKLQGQYPALNMHLAPAIGVSEMVLAAMAQQACTYLLSATDNS